MNVPSLLRLLCCFHFDFFKTIDFAKVVPNFERHTAAFVLYRLDSTDASAGSHEWMLLSYVPDGSPVKQRMLYASTRYTGEAPYSSIPPLTQAEVLFRCCVRAFGREHVC